MCCHTYTPNLSTSSSLRDLMGKSHLEGGFMLRCFQHLSRPYIATQQCRWHDNWSTRGMSIPVLSDRKSTRLNSSHVSISYAVFCLKKKKLIPKHLRRNAQHA